MPGQMRVHETQPVEREARSAKVAQARAGASAAALGGTVGLTLGGLLIMVVTVLAGGLSWPALVAIPIGTGILGVLAGTFLPAAPRAPGHRLGPT
jgi:hypothetical protein